MYKLQKYYEILVASSLVIDQVYCKITQKGGFYLIRNSTYLVPSGQSEFTKKYRKFKIKTEEVVIDIHKIVSKITFYISF